MMTCQGLPDLDTSVLVKAQFIRVVQVQRMWDSMCYGVQDSSPEWEQYQYSYITDIGSAIDETLLIHLN